MIEVRPLQPDDKRSGFRCGNPDLDRFFHRYAGQNQFRHHIGTTWIAVDEGRILGFVTLAAAQIEIEDLPAGRRRKLPDYPLPVLRLARLAVDEHARGKGVGKRLMRLVFEQALEISRRYGCVGVVVDAKPEAVAYYQKLGFFFMNEILEGQLNDRPQPHPMLLPLSAIPACKIPVPEEP